MKCETSADGALLRRSTMRVSELDARIEEKDREIAKLEAEIRALQQRVQHELEERGRLEEQKRAQEAHEQREAERIARELEEARRRVRELEERQRKHERGKQRDSGTKEKRRASRLAELDEEKVAAKEQAQTSAKCRSCAAAGTPCTWDITGKQKACDVCRAAKTACKLVWQADEPKRKRRKLDRGLLGSETVEKYVKAQEKTVKFQLERSRSDEEMEVKLRNSKEKWQSLLESVTAKHPKAARGDRRVVEARAPSGSRNKVVGRSRE